MFLNAWRKRKIMMKEFFGSETSEKIFLTKTVKFIGYNIEYSFVELTNNI